MSETRYFRITGRVQGVGFRAATCNTARGAGLRGWVRNRADGDVEVVATGSQEALMQLREWLARGPRSARVNRVDESTSLEQDLPAPFDIR